MAQGQVGQDPRKERGRYRREQRMGHGGENCFFSSRRRHTRYWRDWSSDVCSSDLQGVAQRLKACGFAVYVALDGRSPRTRELAAKAELTDCGSLEKLAGTCDVILSILNPAAAVENARAVAAAMRSAGHSPMYVDCNAIAPETGD